MLVNNGTGKDVEWIEHGLIQCVILSSASKRKQRKLSVRIVDILAEIRMSTFWVRVGRFAAWPNLFGAAFISFSFPVYKSKDGSKLFSFMLFSMVHEHDPFQNQ
jgi:hypothetical protein